MEPPGDEAGPGAYALREIYRRRHRSGSGSDKGGTERRVDGGEDAMLERIRKAETDHSDKEQEHHKQQQEQHQRYQQPLNIATTITWPEFVGAFVPLGQWEWGDEENQGGNLVDNDELQLLRVAFAMTAAGASRRRGEGANAGQVVSLAELRAASAALDGEEPPEGPVLKALGVSKHYT